MLEAALDCVEQLDAASDMRDELRRPRRRGSKAKRSTDPTHGHLEIERLGVHGRAHQPATSAFIRAIFVLSGHIRSDSLAPRPVEVLRLTSFHRELANFFLREANRSASLNREPHQLHGRNLSKLYK
jgi:hypothetical protein